MPLWAIEAIKSAALLAIQPIFMALVRSLLNPKFIINSLLDLAEIAAKHTETEFDDLKLSELKKLLQADMEAQEAATKK